MTRTPTFLIVAGLFALSACSSGEDDNAALPPNAMQTEKNALSSPSNNASTPDMPGNDDILEGQTTAPHVGNAIPTALRGRWGMVPKDCTSLHGDAKGLLEISANALMFFESRGTLKRIREQEPTRIRADFTFAGEGMTWDNSMTFTVQDNGQTLIRQDQRPEEGAPGLYHYTRCKA